MPARSRRTVVGLAVGVAAVVGGGAAVAATTYLSPQQRSQAIVDDAAARLGVDSSKLSNALKQAYADQIDKAVAAGELTKAQGDALKAQITSGNLPLTGAFGFGRRGGFGGPGGFGHFGLRAKGAIGVGLDAAASYLGLSQADLRTQLQSGKTLAEIAQAQGKTVAGLEQALTDAATKKLDAAVAAGRLTTDQETQLLNELKSHLDDLVNNALPTGGPAGGPGFGFGHERMGMGAVGAGLDAAASYLGLS